MAELKLNIGAGNTQLPGFLNVDIKQGQPAYPLPYPDEAATEIYASHVLEHYSHRQAPAALLDWVRVLAPGGRIRIAVPNLDTIVDQYVKGTDPMSEMYLMGGQTDPNDFHGSVWNEGKLRALMESAGLEKIGPWTSEIGDCASLPVSLNLEGYKPARAIHTDVETWTGPPAGYAGANRPLPLKCVAVMSIPKYGPLHTAACAHEASFHLRFPLITYQGAFWEQCLTRAMEDVIEKQQPDIVLTIDFDSIFRAKDVRELIDLMYEYKNADAVAALQMHRSENHPLMTLADDNGEIMKTIPTHRFAHDLTQIRTAHFGLTVLRVAPLLELPKPWFHSQPDANGSWRDGRVDADTYFWHKWQAAGRTLYQANRVVIGHAEEHIRWPAQDFSLLLQHPYEYSGKGKPEGTWK